jgi:hypothetical protein
MGDPQRIEAYTRNILTLNAVGDILLGSTLILRPATLANLMGFIYSNEIGYLAGGWGVATFILGLTRLYAAKGSSELVFFTALFGLVEGTVLALYGVNYSIVSGIPLSKTSLSTFFALIFAIAYARVFYLRTRNEKE